MLGIFLSLLQYKPESCDIQAHKGDKVKVHYRGKLTDGTVFDSSFERGDPIEFELGSGQVIKGWDQGLLGMCVGEKRKLKIPAKLGYGAQGSPPKIPGTFFFFDKFVFQQFNQYISSKYYLMGKYGMIFVNLAGGATLIFDTELVAVNGKASSGAKADDSEL
ncbi:Peptidyl-prolyl cis-trans isomerase FKBP15-1 [Vitis vinifera]|uniref:peptidylprolyl isomerase n=1 Tax=Vitis vinifera TaxID=29760 RepID=A0A438I7T6_VITVI|nr:Peptidyl-prolyl cis-trans isomerase FKBP15-1 [Vitis vinifera]